MHQIESYGVLYSTLSLFPSYLSSSDQVVQVDGFIPEPKPLVSVLIQGRFLGLCSSCCTPDTSQTLLAEVSTFPSLTTSKLPAPFALYSHILPLLPQHETVIQFLSNLLNGGILRTKERQHNKNVKHPQETLRMVTKSSTLFLHNKLLRTHPTSCESKPIIEAAMRRPKYERMQITLFYNPFWPHPFVIPTHKSKSSALR